MSAKIKSVSFIVLIFVTISTIYYEVVINTVAIKRPILEELRGIHDALLQTNDEAEIKYLIA